MISDRVKQSLRKEYKHSILPKLGLFLVGFLLLFTVFAPFIAIHDPTAQNPELRNTGPVGVSDDATMEHPLGTDTLGRDIFSRVVYGTRVSFTVGILSTLIGFAVGSAVGLASGYYGGYLDDILMRAIDVRLSIPGLVLAITLIGMFGALAIDIPDPWVMLGLASDMPESTVVPGAITLVIALFTWDQFARVARGEALSLREENYVKASRASGAKDWFIMYKHLLPNAIAPLLILGTIRIAAAIILESTLSYLGFSGTTLSWGYDISAGRDYLGSAWWISTMPGIAIVLSVIGINLLGDWFRDALDPELDQPTMD